MNYTKSTHAGFTFMELVIAIAILGLLAALVGPAVFKRFEQGKVNTTKTQMKSIKQAIDIFYTDTGHYPESLSDLIKKPLSEEVAESWNGPYLEKTTLPKDAWRRGFIYRLNPENDDLPYDLFSYGAKGKGAPTSEWITL